MEDFVLKKSVILLIGLLLVSCATATPQPAAPQPAETQPAAPAEPVETTPPTQEPSPTAEAPDAPGLTGQVWYLESYLDAQNALAALMPGSQVTAEFTPEGQVSGSSGCNRYSGGYEVDGDQIKFSPLASTMMACIEPAGLMEQEAAYLQNLGKAASFRLVDGKLEMLDAAGQVILVYSATPPVAAEQPPAQPAEIPASISLEGLKNATYLTEFTASGTATLKDGVYTEPTAPGSASQTTVTLLDDMAYGLLPDGQTAAAVVLAINTGGSGTFFQLSLMVDANGQPINVASTFLGDRVILHQVSFEEGKIIVELTRQGPEDPMCCPTQRMLDVYAYQDGQLTLESSVELAQPSLTGVVWQWQEFQSSDETVTKPENPEAYTLQFLEDGKLTIQADCNQVMGAYTVDGSSLTIEAQAMTKMACPPGSLSDKYIEYLNNVVSFVFQDGDLYLALKMDAGIMKFAAPGSPAADGLTGVVWQWQEFQSSDESVVKPANPEAYTLQFLEDGKVSIKADCNQVIGTYTVDGSSLTIVAQAMTLMACPPGSLSDKYIEYLNNVVSHVFEDGNLFLALKFDSGIMKFTP
jgi:heat shock protein HslJ